MRTYIVRAGSFKLSYAAMKKNLFNAIVLSVLLLGQNTISTKHGHRGPREVRFGLAYSMYIAKYLGK